MSQTFPYQLSVFIFPQNIDKFREWIDIAIISHKEKGYLVPPPDLSRINLLWNASPQKNDSPRSPIELAIAQFGADIQEMHELFYSALPGIVSIAITKERATYSQLFEVKGRVNSVTSSDMKSLTEILPLQSKPGDLVCGLYTPHYEPVCKLMYQKSFPAVAYQSGGIFTEEQVRVMNHYPLFKPAALFLEVPHKELEDEAQAFIDRANSFGRTVLSENNFVSGSYSLPNMQGIRLNT
ncbi:MAG: hypothetical protein ABIJ34_01835 [archaeon]